MIEHWATLNNITRSETFLLKQEAYRQVLAMSMSPKYDVDPKNENDILNSMKAIYSAKN